MSVGDEGLPAWGRAFPDGSSVQLDLVQPTTERGGKGRGIRERKIYFPFFSCGMNIVRNALAVLESNGNCDTVCRDCVISRH